MSRGVRLVFLGLVLVTLLWSFTLNVPNVLLPKKLPQSPPANFSLIADTGCFSWLSTKELVVAIKSVPSDNNNECSREAILTAVGEDIDRQLSIILASESHTGNELRVDVFVDVIHRISIKTTSLELLLEETPSTFDVVAYDNDGNTFSTLEGLEFEWWLESETGGKVLKIVPYLESSYLAPSHIGQLESKGKQGDSILVTGINTGVAWIKTRLTHPLYKVPTVISGRHEFDSFLVVDFCPRMRHVCEAVLHRLEPDTSTPA